MDSTIYVLLDIYPLLIVPFFYDTLKSSFIKKMTCPVLIVKNLTKFEKVHLVLDSEMNLEKFILSYIKLYKNVPVKIYLVQYNFLETREVIINKAPSSDLLDRAKSLLAKEGISTTELLEISGLPENVAEKLKESGMVVSMFNRKGRRRPITDIMACTLSPILIFLGLKRGNKMRILVAVDKNPYSSYVVHEVGKLAVNTWSDITLLGVIKPEEAPNRIEDSDLAKTLLDYREIITSYYPKGECPYSREEISTFTTPKDNVFVGVGKGGLKTLKIIIKKRN